MTSFGTRGSAGFSPYGMPDLRRVISILIWEQESALEDFLSGYALAHAWSNSQRA
jgi:hypothetical protein